MNWSRYFMRDFFTAAEFNNLEDKLRKQRRSDSRNRANQSDRIAELEDEVARLSLLTHALAEACAGSGAITRDGLSEAIHRIDAEDGVIDGKKGGSVEACDQPTTHEFLSDLERKDRSS